MPRHWKNKTVALEVFSIGSIKIPSFLCRGELTIFRTPVCMTRKKYSQNADHNEVINKQYEALRLLRNENRQLKLALGQQYIGCSWEAFLRDIKRKHGPLHSLLSTAFIRRFERDRIWIAIKRSEFNKFFFDEAYIYDFIALWTAAKFGTKFEIRIRIQ